MPVDPGALVLTDRLQEATRCYLRLAYGHLEEPILVKIDLKFPKIMMDSDMFLQSVTERDGVVSLYVELAPMELLPHSVFTVGLLFVINYSNFGRAYV